MNASPADNVSSAAPASGRRMLPCGRLLLSFEWRADRFAHSVACADSPAAQWLLTSLEGTASDAWPASPPWQSLHVDEAAARRSVAMLLGMAGKSHWSAAVELDPEHSTIRWDIACRVAAGARGTLASSYAIAGHVRTLDVRSALVCEPGAEQRGILFRIDQDAGGARLIMAENRMKIVAAAAAGTGDAETVRWSYTIEPAIG